MYWIVTHFLFGQEIITLETNRISALELTYDMYEGFSLLPSLKISVRVKHNQILIKKNFCKRFSTYV
jgi:hypothetical protein